MSSPFLPIDSIDSDLDISVLFHENSTTEAANDEVSISTNHLANEDFPECPFDFGVSLNTNVSSLPVANSFEPEVRLVSETNPYEAEIRDLLVSHCRSVSISSDSVLSSSVIADESLVTSQVLEVEIEDTAVAQAQSETSVPEKGLVSKSWCQQKSTALQCSHRWTIENFSFYGRSKISGVQFAPSDEPLVDRDPGFKWSVCVYPKQKPEHDNEANEEYLSIYLWLHRTQPEPVEAKVTFLFAILDANGEIAYSIDYDYSLVQYSKDSSGWGFPRFISWNILREDMGRFFPNDTLTVYCKIKSLVDIIQEVGPKESITMSYDHLWLKRSITGDVTFYVGKNRAVFHAHKAVLKSQFLVFSEELCNESANNDSTRLELYIEDLEPNLFETMLEFVYQRPLTHLQFIHSDLLPLAIKYQLTGLKEKCEEALIKSFRSCFEEKVISFLVWSEINKAAKLRAECIDYIRSNAVKVMQSTSWENFRLDYPHLIEDVFNIN